MRAGSTGPCCGNAQYAGWSAEDNVRSTSASSELSARLKRTAIFLLCFCVHALLSTDRVGVFYTF
ncbi:hypothetical protein C8Q79DRAFT_955209 [Trametes meyenii]|nr:hypothetical protein C8Q79DRAFT_955209 [Trametes meyenii]